MQIDLLIPVWALSYVLITSRVLKQRKWFFSPFFRRPRQWVFDLHDDAVRLFIFKQSFLRSSSDSAKFNFHAWHPIFSLHDLAAEWSRSRQKWMLNSSINEAFWWDTFYERPAEWRTSAPVSFLWWFRKASDVVPAAKKDSPSSFALRSNICRSATDTGPRTFHSSIQSRNCFWKNLAHLKSATQHKIMIGNVKAVCKRDGAGLHAVILVSISNDDSKRRAGSGFVYVLSLDSKICKSSRKKAWALFGIWPWSFHPRRFQLLATSHWRDVGMKKILAIFHSNKFLFMPTAINWK